MQPLLDHIQKLTGSSALISATVANAFTHRKFKKKTIIFSTGDPCKENYFVIKGILRLYFVNEKGVEQTTQFAIENWWITDIFAFYGQAPTSYCLQAVEETEVAAISLLKLEKLLAEAPSLEKYFRLVYQKGFGAMQVRIKFLYDLPKSELYFSFNRSFPGFTQRIPQYLLASYLDITPEYLSELRRKDVS